MNNNEKRWEALYHHLYPMTLQMFHGSNVEHSLNILWSRKRHCEAKKVSVREIFVLSIFVYSSGRI